MKRLLLIALLVTTLAPIAPVRALESPVDWGSRLVITYRGLAPISISGGELIQRAGSRAIVDLGRPVLPSDLARFAGADVLRVEPDLRVHPALLPTDPNAGAQWDMSDAAAGAADYSVRAPGAWDITTGSTAITVAVIDTGITTHSEFTGRTVAGYDFIGDSLVANDGGGRDADPSDPGDWITSTESDGTDAGGWFLGCPATNSSWHGTHVAGTIGAAANNAVGIAGLNWVSKIQPVRALGKCGGYLSDIADAILWAAGGTVSGVTANATPARIISLSLGGSGSCPSYMQSAIDGARALGAMVVVAAGNNNQNVSNFTPANCAGVIAVAATGRNGKRAYYSNYGSLVDIAAPGGNSTNDPMILSTLNTGTQGPVAESYASYQGTSMATPHVAGVLSLLLSAKPTLTEADALTLLAANSTAFPSDTGVAPCSTSGNCGVGIINATKLLQAATNAKAAQTITFPSQIRRVIGEAPFGPGATASSGLTVSYATKTASICTTDGTLVTVVLAGTCTITASQSGNDAYLAATAVSKSFVVLAAPTLVAASAAAWTKTTAVTLAITYPANAGVIEISNYADFSIKATFGLVRSVSWTLLSGDGQKTVYARFSGGSMGSPVTISDGIGLDTLAPVISSATATGKTASTITYTFLVAATDAGSGMKDLAISIDGGKTTKYTRAYAASFSYKSGYRVFWVRVSDALGTWSAWRQVTVTLN